MYLSRCNLALWLNDSLFSCQYTRILMSEFLRKTAEYVYPFLCVSQIIITGSVLYDADVMYFASGMRSNVYFNKQKLKKNIYSAVFSFNNKAYSPFSSKPTLIYTIHSIQRSANIPPDSINSGRWYGKKNSLSGSVHIQMELCMLRSVIVVVVSEKKEKGDAGIGKLDISLKSSWITWSVYKWRKRCCSH